MYIFRSKSRIAGAFSKIFVAKQRQDLDKITLPYHFLVYWAHLLSFLEHSHISVIYKTAKSGGVFSSKIEVFVVLKHICMEGQTRCGQNNFTISFPSTLSTSTINFRGVSNLSNLHSMQTWWGVFIKIWSFCSPQKFNLSLGSKLYLSHERCSRCCWWYYLK